MTKKFCKFEFMGGDWYDVWNHKTELIGHIEFMGKWKKHKQFIFCPDEDTFFTSGCLIEIVKFLDKLNKQKELEGLLCVKQDTQKPK